jgi:colanic acid/amylovoran biosynthesis protein
MRILITNSVPLNGGDEALLRAAIGLLRDQFPDASCKVLCKDVDICRRYHPDLDLDTDLDYIRPARTAAAERLFKARLALNDVIGPRWAARLAAATASADARRVIAEYRAADLVVSCPGGFLHDFYDVERRFMGFELAMALGKPVVLLGQSVGPFWKARSQRRAREVLGGVDAILLREERSLRHLEESGVDAARATLTSDVAFYWRRLAPQLFASRRGPLRRVAMCFREWRGPAGTAACLTAKAARLCEHLFAANPQLEIVFLSTCQGIPEYIDDSRLASEIVGRLPDRLRARCTVDGTRYGPEDLIRRYASMDAYIGMRLHGAILSMLGGTPAMAIAYEDKTPGIYGGLGFGPFQVDHRAPAERWIECADAFARHSAEIHERLPAALDRAAAQVSGCRPVLAHVLARSG